jgi:hypothetical protein
LATAKQWLAIAVGIGFARNNGAELERIPNVALSIAGGRKWQ